MVALVEHLDVHQVGQVDTRLLIQLLGAVKCLLWLKTQLCEKVVLEYMAALCDLSESGACYRTLGVGTAMEILKY